MAVSIHSFLFTQRNNSSKKNWLKYYFRYGTVSVILETYSGYAIYYASRILAEA